VFALGTVSKLLAPPPHRLDSEELPQRHPASSCATTETPHRLDSEEPYLRRPFGRCTSRRQRLVQRGLHSWISKAACVVWQVYMRGVVSTVERALQEAKRIGYPVMLKASEGGGGKGIRTSHTPQDIPAHFQQVLSGRAVGSCRICTGLAEPAFGENRQYGASRPLNSSDAVFAGRCDGHAGAGGGARLAGVRDEAHDGRAPSGGTGMSLLRHTLSPPRFGWLAFTLTSRGEKCSGSSGSCLPVRLRGAVKVAEMRGHQHHDVNPGNPRREWCNFQPGEFFWWQMVGDEHGCAAPLSGRDCSTQRYKHQGLPSWFRQEHVAAEEARTSDLTRVGRSSNQAVPEADRGGPTHRGATRRVGGHAARRTVPHAEPRVRPMRTKLYNSLANLQLCPSVLQGCWEACCGTGLGSASAAQLSPASAGLAPPVPVEICSTAASQQPCPSVDDD
jgi:hypothetical protein